MEQKSMNENRAPEKTSGAGGDAHRDPLTGAPGSHPVGTGLGAAGAGAAGAAIGTAVGGPVGGMVGAAVGAVAGGLGGKAVAEAIDPTAEEAYWRDNYASQPWRERSYEYEDYHPAFRTGYEGRGRYEGKTYDQAESDLQRDYEKSRGQSRLEWEKARAATRAAWDRVDRSIAEARNRPSKTR